MAGELAGKTALVVDDDRDILMAIETALSDLDLEIIKATDGNEAIRQADARSPDIVILDMMLPKRSGFLVLEKLKRGKKPSDPPRVVMITANLGTRHRIYAEGLGVDAYLNKPFRMEKLVDTVKKVMGAETAKQG